MDGSGADAAVLTPNHGDTAVGYVILKGPVSDPHRKRGRDDAPEADGEGATRGAPRRATTAVVVAGEEEDELEGADDFLPLGPASEDNGEQLAFIPVDPAEDDDDDGMISYDDVMVALGELGDPIIPQLDLTDEDGQQQLASQQNEHFVPVDPDEDDYYVLFGYDGGVLLNEEDGQQVASQQEEGFVPIDPDEDDYYLLFGHGGNVLLNEEDGQFASSEEDEDLLSMDRIESEDIVYDAGFSDFVRAATT